MAKLTLTVPPAMKEWIDTQVASGRYLDAADYLRDLVRRDQERGDGDLGNLAQSLEESLGELADALNSAELQEAVDELAEATGPQKG